MINADTEIIHNVTNKMLGHINQRNRVRKEVYDRVSFGGYMDIQDALNGLVKSRIINTVNWEVRRVLMDGTT